MVALFLLPVFVLGLGIYLSARPRDRRFGAAFLCSFLIGSFAFLVGGLALLNALYFA